MEQSWLECHRVRAAMPLSLVNTSIVPPLSVECLKSYVDTDRECLLPGAPEANTSIAPTAPHPSHVTNSVLKPPGGWWHLLPTAGTRNNKQRSLSIEQQSCCLYTNLRQSRILKPCHCADAEIDAIRFFCEPES
jgi:hypothetical protein